MWPIIANEEILSVSQSWAGSPGRLVANSSEYQVMRTAHGSPDTRGSTETFPSWQAWAKPVGNGGVALLVVRVWAGSANATLTFSLKELQARSGYSGPMRVRDVFAHSDNGTATDVVRVALAELPEHGSTMLVLKPIPPAASSTAATAAAATVHVDTAKLLSRTSPRYASWNIDASRNRGFLWRNLSSPNLLQLAAGLPAGYLRFGGSGNDALWYGDGIGQSSCADAPALHFNCLNSTMVDGLLALSEAASSRLVFGLNLDNAGLGRHWDGSSSWNSSNAISMIRYLAARGQPYAYELGTSPTQ